MSEDNMTGEARATWVRHVLNGSWPLGVTARHMEATACQQFDAWIRDIRADAWAEGEADGRYNEHEGRPGLQVTNPYREEQE